MTPSVRFQPISIRPIRPSGRRLATSCCKASPPRTASPPHTISLRKQAVEQFYRQDPQGNLDRIYAKLIEDAPAIKLAKAKRDEAKADLDQAELNLRYCEVVAEIDGVITRRNVNPGNNVQAGEGLMALRSLTDIWIDANFKETQLSELRIGQPAELEVDMYGSHKTFKGRISGFTYGTGSTLALLPPQNATGNFIKVVQRLPVRIDLSDYDPDKDPLFVGLSVIPYVYYKEQHLTGADAGKVLQTEMTRPADHQLRTRCRAIPCRPRLTARRRRLLPERAPSRQAHRPGSGTSAEARRRDHARPGATSRAAINPWLVAAAVVIPTFMEVLDTTIANVAACLPALPADSRRQ